MKTHSSQQARWSGLAIAFVAAVSLTPQLRGQESADVIVYGATSGGVTAAVQAAWHKASVLLVAPEKCIGGLTSGGLGWTDIGHPKIAGGLSRDFYHRVWKHYTAPEAWKSGTREAFLARPGQHVRAIDERNQVM